MVNYKDADGNGGNYDAGSEPGDRVKLGMVGDRDSREVGLGQPQSSEMQYTPALPARS